MKERISNILKEMRRGTVERGEVLALSLLAAVAGESIFLLGLPGVGKSMVARRLKLAFRDAKGFEYLMSRFSTPDEIFGPVSISRLKDHDLYERITAGYLPEADVVFLDEIWKAGPAIQNTLLTVLNERIYLNGNRLMKLPLKGVVAASNELPARDEGLEALWDRFLIRYIVNPIRGRENFISLLTEAGSAAANEANPPGAEESLQPLTDDECREILGKSAEVTVPEKLIGVVCTLRDKLEALLHRKDAVSGREDPENARYYVSDRRWKKAVATLRVSACLNGRRRVDISDMLLLIHMLWNDDGAIPLITDLVCRELATAIFADIVKAQENPKRHVAARKRTSAGAPELAVVDGRYHMVECEGSPMRIRIEDYRRVSGSPREIFFASEDTEGVLRFQDEGMYAVKAVKPGYLRINSYQYPLRTVEGETEMQRGGLADLSASFGDKARKADALVAANLFTSGGDAALAFHDVMADLQRRME